MRRCYDWPNSTLHHLPLTIFFLREVELKEEQKQHKRQQEREAQKPCTQPFQQKEKTTFQQQIKQLKHRQKGYISIHPLLNQQVCKFIR